MTAGRGHIMGYNQQLREEEVKNKLRRDYFADYDATPIVGDIDFAVAIPRGEGELDFEQEFLLWAEAKKGRSADIRESFVQLIITIGKARTFDRHLPPAFLGAFDAERIAFIPYNAVLDIFYMSDFDWRVRPSDHTTREFGIVMRLVSDKLDDAMTIFRFGADDAELRAFIRANFVTGRSDVSRVRINRNNFTHIYKKWLVEVKPSIDIDWDVAKAEGVVDIDFYLADILSEHNVSLKDKLFVLLRSDRYYYNIRRKATGALSFDSVEFRDGQRAHRHFWNRYDRPPRRDYWDYIVERRELLVPPDDRERKGAYFTPDRWVELSQDYLAAELGEDWQDEYTVWDCAAGTGNLLAGLTNKWNVWASTIDEQDVRVMHDRIASRALNLLDNHVFQFDFLNDPFTKLPQPLQDIIADPDKRKKLVIYINPPYAEASNARTISGTGANRQALVKETKVYDKYQNTYVYATRELFAQFFIRIYHEIPSCLLAEFSKLKILQASNFRDFRKNFRAKLGRIFIVPADSFDNVRGDFPIGFFIWHCAIRDTFEKIRCDVYNEKGESMGHKSIYSYDKDRFIIEWLRQFYDKSHNNTIAYLRLWGTDVQNNKYVYVCNKLSPNDIKKRMFTRITGHNLIEMCIYYTVRKVIPATWLNDRDQFLYPNDSWRDDAEFQSDCLAYALFTNNVSCGNGVNHWIPFTEAEVDAREKFASHFMSDYIRGRHCPAPQTGDSTGLFDTAATAAAPLAFSPEARAVIDAGRELWRYYHAQPGALADAALYDIKMHFQGTKVTKSGKVQMAAESTDATYTALMADLRTKLKALALRIEPQVYRHGFLKE